MNPILPQNLCIPDCEARVWADGRLYIYGSYDVPGRNDYCSEQYKVFSTDNLRDWTDHGVSFRGQDAPFAESNTLFAPDCAYYRGRYYLFFCMPWAIEGVAVSDSPTGPFSEASAIEGADGSGIDPTILIDGEKAYLYWGQHELRCAELNEDLRSIRPETLRVGVLTEAEHGFHEGASIRKIGERYCLVYCDTLRGRATCLAYAWSDAPMGPFKRGGVIIDNLHCDTQSWNIHGSICEFKDQWYVFYHRSSDNSRFSRRTCIEPITIGEDGSIKEVKMTTQGADGPLPANECLEAWRNCFVYGTLQNKLENEDAYLHSEGQGNFASYRDLEFRSETRCRLRLRGHGHLYVNLGSAHSAFIAEFKFEELTEWTTVEATLNVHPEGIQSLHLFFVTGSIDVESVQFL